jgi:hypothetical protein
LPGLSRDEVVDGVVAPNFALDHGSRGCLRLADRFGADRLRKAHAASDNHREGGAGHQAGEACVQRIGVSFVLGPRCRADKGPAVSTA